MRFVPAERHLLRARDLADARYAEPLDVADLARIAGLSRAHFSRESGARSARDAQASYEELTARGIEFTEPPEERPYGIDSAFRDPSGNQFRLTQVREPAAV
jgi:hypothetical protein